MKYLIAVIVIPFLVLSSGHMGEAKTSQKKKTHHLNSKTVRAIHKRQGLRLPKVDAYKKKGFIGEGDQGVLVIKTTKSLSSKKAKALKSLVASENKDREKIFAIIIKANKYSKAEVKVLRESMFESYLSADPIGVYYFKGRHWIKK